LRLQQSVLGETICGVILIGVDPIAIEPALLGVLLPRLCWTKQSRVSLTLSLAKSVIAPAAGAFILTAEVMSILPPDAF
jgi:hypothetical protein